MSFKWFFLFLALTAILFNKRTHFSNFSRGSFKENFCEIIVKSAHWPGRKCRLKVFLFLALTTILFSGAEPF